MPVIVLKLKCRFNPSAISQDEPRAMSYELRDRSFDNETGVLKLMARSSQLK